MSLIRRLGKLELIMNPPEPERFQITHFVIDANSEPTGYQCNGVEIIRSPGEPLDVFQSRCLSLAVEPYSLFKPLEKIS